MKPRISREVVSAIRRELVAQRNKTKDWLAFSTELQDDSTFLLVSVEMPTGLENQRYLTASEDIRRIVGGKVASVGDDYSWMGVVKVEGRVVESVLPLEGR